MSGICGGDGESFVESCICVFVYLCICVFVYLCICVFVYLCFALVSGICGGDGELVKPLPAIN